MSEHTQAQHSNRRQRHEQAAEQDAAKATASGNGADAETKPVPTMVAEIKYKDGPTVTAYWPRKWFAGMVNTEHSALIIDTSNLRQLCSTEGANAKSRAERLAKAIAANDTAGVVANQPLTADDYVAKWMAYEGPAIGDMQRMGSEERMRLEAGWSAWVATVTEHNAYVAAFKGEPADFHPPMPKAGKAGVKVGYSIPSAKTKGESDEAFKERREAAQAGRTAFIEKLLATPAWAERVQIQLDRLQAERGKAKESGVPVVETAGDSLL